MTDKFLIEFVGLLNHWSISALKCPRQTGVLFIMTKCNRNSSQIVHYRQSLGRSLQARYVKRSFSPSPLELVTTLTVRSGDVSFPSWDIYSPYPLPPTVSHLNMLHVFRVFMFRHNKVSCYCSKCHKLTLPLLSVIKDNSLEAGETNSLYLRLVHALWSMCSAS